MSITRNRLSFERNFVQVPNDWMRDKNLSRRARGLLAEIMSHSVGWEITVESLVDNGPEGRDAIRSAISELESAGYLVRKTTRSGGKFSGTDYMIHEPTPPAPENPTLVNSSENTSPAPEKPTSVEPQQRTLPFKEECLLPSVVSAEAPANPNPDDSRLREMAKTVHENTKGGYPMMAVLGITKSCVTAGFDVEAVYLVLGQLWKNGKPMTKSLVIQTLEGIVKPGESKPVASIERFKRNVDVIQAYQSMEDHQQKEVTR